MQNVKCRGNQTDAGEGGLGFLLVLNCPCCEENSTLHTYCINFCDYISFRVRSFKSQGFDRIPGEFI